MKHFFNLLVVTFNVSFVFPSVNSMSVNLENKMDSSVMYNVQKYGAKADGNNDNSKVRET